jgi:uncharacterized membrane protein
LQKEEWSKMKIKLIAVLVTLPFLLFQLILPLSLPTSVNALGIALGPTDIAITNGLRGAEYERTVMVFNPGDEDYAVQMGSDGDISSWVHFYSMGESPKSISILPVAGKSNSSVTVKFSIPADTPNGTYAGTVYAETIPGEGTEGAIQTKLRAPSSVKITISGEQLISGTVESMNITDIEINYPLRVALIFRNTGNVTVKPEIDGNITRDGALISSFSSSNDEVQVDKRGTIDVEWDSTGNDAGDYVASINVLLGGETIYSKESSFKILPFGTLSRSGLLQDLAMVESMAKVGYTAKFVATFANTGQIETKAKFVGEAYCNGVFLQAVTSDEITVPVGESAQLRFYLPFTKAGEYQVKGYVNYEGKQTEEKSLSVTVSGTGGTTPTDNSDSGSSSTGLVIGIVAGAAVLLAVGGIFVLRRKRT